jgi:23S rRNA pseudouridine2605 synthase
MGRWREMSQYEVDILSAEVGLTPVAMPQMNAKSKDKLDRMQRKSSRPMAKAERVRTLRPATGAATAPAAPRASREPQIEGERPGRKPAARQDGESGPRTPRPANGRTERGEGRGTPVADRPADTKQGSNWSMATSRRASAVAHRPVPASVRALVVASLSNRLSAS